MPVSPVTGSGLALGSGKAKGGHSGVHAAVSCQQSAPPHWKHTVLAAPHSAPTPPSQGPVQPQLLPLCSGRIHLPQSLREDSTSEQRGSCLIWNPCSPSIPEHSLSYFRAAE